MTSDYGSETGDSGPSAPSTSFVGGAAAGGGGPDVGGGPSSTAGSGRVRDAGGASVEEVSPADREGGGAGSAARAGTDTAAPAQPPVARTAGAAGTRTSHTWVALAAGLFCLIVVLVFILQNLKSVKAHFFWVTWSVPLAVDLLLAAVLGGLIMFAAGSLRILQLRRAARRRN